MRICRDAYDSVHRSGTLTSDMVPVSVYWANRKIEEESFIIPQSFMQVHPRRSCYLTTPFIDIVLICKIISYHHPKLPSNAGSTYSGA